MGGSTWARHEDAEAEAEIMDLADEDDVWGNNLEPEAGLRTEIMVCGRLGRGQVEG